MSDNVPGSGTTGGSLGGFPAGFPGGFPGGLPDGSLRGFPGGLPDEFPGGLPVGLPDGFPDGFPDGLPGGLPDGFPGCPDPDGDPPPPPEGPPINIGGVDGPEGIDPESSNGAGDAKPDGAIRATDSSEGSPGLSESDPASGGTRYAVGGWSSAGSTVSCFPGGKTAATWLPHAQRYIAPCPSVKTLVPEGMEIFLPVQ